MTQNLNSLAKSSSVLTSLGKIHQRMPSLANLGARPQLPAAIASADRPCLRPGESLTEPGGCGGNRHRTRTGIHIHIYMYTLKQCVNINIYIYIYIYINVSTYLFEASRKSICLQLRNAGPMPLRWMPIHRTSPFKPAMKMRYAFSHWETRKHRSFDHSTMTQLKHRCIHS